MYPFWDTIIAPLLRAAGARRVVEIGALRGENTTLLLDALGDEAELHVVDPSPEFDPTEHATRFGGRYVFHRDLSLNVLTDHGAFDAALVDGDHNWYTVYNELCALRDVARKDGQPLPLLVLHDVGWPYGRRDLYYDPATIPAEHRQPYQRRGMRHGQSSLLRAGGLNAELCNAETEGGPRNGVLTALEDFVAEHDDPLRVVIVPIYFGLAIVADRDRLAARPELARLLDRLESSDGKDDLLALGERIRLDAATFEQNVWRMHDRRIGHLARRYLDVTKSALLDEHYIENEVRIAYLLECAERGRAANPDVVCDPRRFLVEATERLERSRRSGRSERDDSVLSCFPYTAVGRDRLDALERVLETLERERIAGDLAECGVGRGGTGVFLRAFLDAHDVTRRTLWLADPFRTTPPGARADGSLRQRVPSMLADLNQVREAFDRFGLLDDRVRFLQGEFADALPDAPIERLALLRVGDGDGASLLSSLEALYDRVTPGGFVMIDGVDDDVRREVVEAFRSRRNVAAGLDRLDWYTVAWRKTAADGQATGSVGAGGVPARPPLAPPAPKDALDLSVVVVFFNMRREAARTLHSLSRAYQRGVDDLRYEVLVVENGSDPEQRLGEDFVRSFGEEFRYLDMGERASASPTPALNRGVRESRGRALALMIDGAHVLTPGVMRFGVAGLRTYEPAVVTTQQWYVGPGQQPTVVQAGYDQREEDSLFEAIEWPSDGYRLFEVGHFIGERDWLDGQLESNCIFVSRSVLEQVGGFDDSFSMPGGGFANLDLYERLASSPDVAMATILGEGSFHQVHGGTTTNEGDIANRRGATVSYGEHYEGLRGRSLRGPATPMHFVGSFTTTSARRTRARRMSTEAFSPRRAVGGSDGFPTESRIVPDELKTAFVEAFWHGLAWDTTTWAGHRVPTPPTDLVVYQEIISRVRPDWVVETGTGDGGRALFLASVCDVVGHGSVISLDDRPSPELPEHPRLRYVRERPDSPAAFDAVRDLTGGTENALVVLGSHRPRQPTIAEFERYAPFVAIGSYVVVERTVVNGNPVWPGHGPGPAEAVRYILHAHRNFVQDPAMERHALTFNPGGFLKRIS